MTRTLAGLLALALTLAGCGKGKQLPGKENAFDRKPAASTGYTLEVHVVGLVAFVQDATGIWALMPQTRYNPLQPQETDLPPFALDDYFGIPDDVRSQQLLCDYPLHTARLEWNNAIVTAKGSTLQVSPPLSLDGEDVTFPGLSQVAPFSKPSLDLLVNVGKVRETTAQGGYQLTPDEDQEIAAMDRIDPSLVGNKLDRRLTSRARLDFGTFSAIRELDKEYTFHIPAEGTGCTKSPVPLGEEIDTSVGNVTPTSFTIHLARSGTDFLVQPLDPSRSVVITIINNDPNSTPTSPPHPMVFRWFHGLSAGNQVKDVQYFTCLDNHKGGNKCPQKTFINPIP